LGGTREVQGERGNENATATNDTRLHTHSDDKTRSTRGRHSPPVIPSVQRIWKRARTGGIVHQPVRRVSWPRELENNSWCHPRVVVIRGNIPQQNGRKGGGGSYGLGGQGETGTRSLEWSRRQTSDQPSGATRRAGGQGDRVKSETNSGADVKGCHLYRRR
jgi:hypothetical protein